MASSSSQLWTPFRALGFVCDGVPFALQKRGSAYFVTTVIGTAFQTYNCEKINLLFVGKQCSQAHSAVAAQGDFVFTGTGRRILKWKRGKIVATWKGHTSTIIKLLPFGDHIVSLSSGNEMFVWEARSGEQVGRLEFGAGFTACVVVHPPTYLNKILVGSTEGPMRIYNIRTQKMIYEFKGWGSKVTALAEAPALDVVAVGLADGRIIVHNIKMDETVMKFKQDNVVTSLAFRTDGEATLASGGVNGTISVWDLEKKRVLTVVRRVHTGPVLCMQFLAGQPLLLTSGEDNSLKLWIFDSPDGTARLLKSREGHKMPPTRIRYYGEDGKQILSGGLDQTLRCFSTIQDSQSRELSQGAIVSKSKAWDVDESTLRLPPVLQLDSATIRERAWDNVVTCHMGDSAAYTWCYDRRGKGKHTFVPPKEFPRSEIKSVCVSMCGNFAVCGALNGRIDKYNMQSGFHRGSFGDKDELKHTKAVRGVAVNNVNRVLISASLDCTVKFWDFLKCNHLGSIELPSPVAEMMLHRDSSLAAVSCDDLEVRVIDVDTRRIVRRFAGHTNRITDMSFSPDARWLATCSMDGTMRVWDNPSGRCIDWLSFDKAPTSATFSPTGDFLATTHVESVGIYMWANRDYFSTVMLKRIGEAPSVIALPMAVVTGVDREDAVESSEDDDVCSHDGEAITSDLPDIPYQVEDLVTMSELPATTWQNIANIDLIRARNKPIEPPKAPPKAPFFLPTVAGLETAFAPLEADDDAAQSRILDFAAMEGRSRFVLMLEKAKHEDTFGEVTTHLKTLGPSAVDGNFRSLEGVDELALAVSYFCSEMSTNRNYEIVQAYLNLFVKLHGDELAENSDLAGAVDALLEAQVQTWDELAGKFQHNICLIKFLRGAVS